jgi:hypothetical protein
MDHRARLLSRLILCGAFVHIMVPAALRADETWDWTSASGDEPAKAWITATGQPDVALAMTFPPARGCYTADLMLTDSAGEVLPSQQVTVTADGEQFVLAVTPGGIAGVYEAPPAVFHALKRARTVRLATPEAAYVFSLAGSAAAINSVWKACEGDVDAGGADEPDKAQSEAATAQTEGIAGDAPVGAPSDEDSIDERANASPGEPSASDTSVRHRVLPLIVLLFAVGNAVLLLRVIARTCSLPSASVPDGGQWRRGAALVGAVGWITLPPIVYVAYGALGAALAMAGYLTSGLIIAALMKPSVIQYAAGRLLDWLHDLRLRGKGLSRGSRLIVDGYRRAARRQGLAPTAKTTDAEILHLFERVGSAFKSVADQRGESLRAQRINYIVWKFLQARETLGNDAFDAYLQQELSRYRSDGLPAAYRHELRL